MPVSLSFNLTCALSLAKRCTKCTHNIDQLIDKPRELSSWFMKKTSSFYNNKYYISIHVTIRQLEYAKVGSFHDSLLAFRSLYSSISLSLSLSLTLRAVRSTFCYSFTDIFCFFSDTLCIHFFTFMYTIAWLSVCV